MLQIIHDAGWPIWLLIVTSVLGLALIIERFLSLRTKLIVPEHLLDRVTELMRQKSPSSNALEKLASSSPLGRVLAEVIAVRRHDTIYRQAAIEDVGKDVAYRLNRYVPSLATVAVVSPLLGLFGTVVGMIEIFAIRRQAATRPNWPAAYRWRCTTPVSVLSSPYPHLFFIVFSEPGSTIFCIKSSTRPARLIEFFSKIYAARLRLPTDYEFSSSHSE